MKAKKSKSRKTSAKKGGKKKKVVVYQSKYPYLDMDKLKQVPVLNWIARLSNAKGGEMIEGTVPMDYSFNKIKEKIQEKHSNSCSNLRLFIMEGNEKKYLDAIMCKTFLELGINTEKFSLFYEFEPFVHPMLEAGLI